MFVVFPAIRDSEEMVSVEATLHELRDQFGDERVGEVHGQLSAEGRRAAMRAFAEGEHDILVGTTVLEVGVDIPDANLIVIEQAERFGLAQLHQLRGRVGRAGQKSACLLTFAEPLTEEAEARLGALCQTDDGFRLAERDLERRGAGHLFGYRQSGASGLQFANLLEDRPLIGQAASIVDRIVETDPGLDDPRHASAKAAVAQWQRNAAVREDAG